AAGEHDRRSLGPGHHHAGIPQPAAGERHPPPRLGHPRSLGRALRLRRPRRPADLRAHRLDRDDALDRSGERSVRGFSDESQPSAQGAALADGAPGHPKLAFGPGALGQRTLTLGGASPIVLRHEHLEPAVPHDLTPELIKKALRAVKDPELGLNIIDIGLVYDAIVSEEGDVTVKMTLTSPGCPAGAEIMGDAKLVLEDLEGVKSVTIDLVWEPYWTPEKMDPRVRAFLG